MTLTFSASRAWGIAPVLLILALFASLMLSGCSTADLERSQKLATEAQTRAEQAEQALAKAQGLVTILQATVDAMRPAAEKGDATAADLMAKAQAALAKAKDALPAISGAAQEAAKLAGEAKTTLAELEKQAKDSGGQIPWYVAVGTFVIHYAPGILARVIPAAVPGGGIIAGLAGALANLNWNMQATHAQRKEEEDAAKPKAVV